MFTEYQMFVLLQNIEHFNSNSAKNHNFSRQAKRKIKKFCQKFLISLKFCTMDETVATSLFVFIHSCLFMRQSKQYRYQYHNCKKILKIASLSQLAHWETIKEQIVHRVIATLASSYFIFILSLPHDLAKKP